MNYSPLRYPGGKAKFAIYIKQIIDLCPNSIDTYIEPFAGGAGVALELLFSGKVKRIIINDYDKAIYSFWRAVINHTEELIELISTTEVTIDEWYKQKKIYVERKNKYSLELAFATFFLNRTNRSGILEAGPIGGYSQTGNYLIDVRYNKSELIKRIQRIAEHKKKILVYNKDIRAFISKVVSNYEGNAFVYFDPPYFEQGRRLYKNCLKLEDHQEIANYIKNQVKCDWIITYDDVAEIRQIYAADYCKKYKLHYSIANSNEKQEIIIFKHKYLCPE